MNHEQVEIHDDEISLTDLMLAIWRQRGLVIGLGLIVMLLFLVFAGKSALVAAPTSVSYSIVLPFAQKFDEEDPIRRYPNGAPFSVNDLISFEILQAVAPSFSEELDLDQFTERLSVSPSMELIELAEEKLTKTLGNAKTPDAVRQAAQEALQQLQYEGHQYATLTFDLVGKGGVVSSEQGAKILEAIVKTWAESTVERGLMGAGIDILLSPIDFGANSNVLASYDLAREYVTSMALTVGQLKKLDGSQGAVVGGMTLTDVERKLKALKIDTIEPLHEFAYSNISVLKSVDAAFKVKFESRLRLLEIERDRLKKLIASYDQILVDLIGSAEANFAGKEGIQSDVATYDQSFLNSMLDLGSKLDAVDVRKTTLNSRARSIKDLITLEKEIAILKGGKRNSHVDAEAVLKQSLPDIQNEVNAILKSLKAFGDAVSRQSLESEANVYVANSKPAVKGGYLKIMPRAAVFTVISLMLGLMLGVVVALIRQAMLQRKD